MKPGNEEYVQGSDQNSQFQWNGEKQIEANRGTDDFRKVGGAYGDFRQQPQGQGHSARNRVAAGLGQVTSRADPAPIPRRAQRLCRRMAIRLDSRATVSRE